MLTLEELKRARERGDLVWVAYQGKVRSGTLLWVRGHMTKRGTEKELSIRFPGDFASVSFWDDAVFSSELDALRHWTETLRGQQARAEELLREANVRISELTGQAPPMEEPTDNPGARWGWTKEQTDTLRKACVLIKDFFDIVSPALPPPPERRKVKCQRCQGKGYGKTRDFFPNAPGIQNDISCPSCKGSGKVEKEEGGAS